MKVKEGLLRYISPSTPDEERLKAARLIEPAGPHPPLPPEDLVTVLFVLSYDKSGAVSEAAGKGLGELPLFTILSALGKRLDPVVIKKLLSMHASNEAVMTMASTNAGIDDETLKTLAEKGPAEVIEVIAEDRERIVKNPSILEALRKNPLSSKLLITALDGFLLNPSAHTEAPAAQKAGPLDEEAARAVHEEFLEDKEKEKKSVGDRHNIYKLVGSMTFGEKVKLALTGNKTAREFFAKDPNKILASSVLRNPRITEDEVLRIASSKSTPDDILRQVAHHKEWMKNYNIKLSMVTNPKTPVSVSLKLLDFILEKDLEGLSKSKNIPSVIASSARRKVDTKKKR